MADYDFLTLKQRTDVLRHIQSELELAIRAAREAQKQYDLRSTNDFYMDHAAMNAAVQGSLNLSRDHSIRAKAELDKLLTKYTISLVDYYPNFIQRYRVEVGKSGVDGIEFAVATGPLYRMTPYRNPNGTGMPALFSNGGIATHGGSNLWYEDDLVIVAGTTSNDGVYTVKTSDSSSQRLSVDEVVASEICTAKGASVTVIRRSVA